MRFHVHLLHVVVLAACPVLVCAQSRGVTFERLSVAQGLYGNEVHCILQDSRGYMWFGTEKGLNRYDGYGFTVFKHEPGNSSSIVDAKVQSLCEDKQGTLWIGTWSGLEKFDRATSTFSHFLPDTHAPSGDWRNVIYDLREDRAGTLWLGGDAVKKFDKLKGTFTYLRHDSNDKGSLIQDNVDAIYEDGSGTLWFGTAAGLERFDPATQHFVHYWVDEHVLAPNYFGFHWIQMIYEDRRGTLWLCTNGGPVAFNRTTGEFKPYQIHQVEPDSSPAHSVSSILEDDSGTLWIGTWGGGYLTYDVRADRFVSHALDPAIASNNSICALYKDRAGTIWMGTNGDGLLKVVRSEERFTPFVHVHKTAELRGVRNRIPAVTSSLQDNDVRFIYQGASGTISIGTATGTDEYDRPERIFRHWATWDWPYSITGELHSRFDRVIWTGIEGDGINKVQENPYRRKFFGTRDEGLGGSACSFFEDRQRIIWMLTSEAGLCQFDPKTEKFKNLGIGQSQPFVAARMIVEDSLDSTPRGWALWIGTNDGLWRYDARSDAFRRLGHDPKDPASLASNTVTTVFRDSYGVIWVGTDRGLNKLDAVTGKFEVYSEDNGLPDKGVLGTLEDGHGRLWVSTTKAISKFDPRSKRFVSYSMKDVLPDIRFGAGCCLRTDDGEMLFGGNGGFVSFYPDSIRDNLYVPPIAITGFKKFDLPVELDSTMTEKHVINLSYKDNVFSFEFVALNFIKPEMNQYAYKLDGHDSAWIYCGNRQYARYLNVEPGAYTFRVKGSNNDGVWNEHGASLAVIVTPPFWATWWFRGLAFITALVSVGGTIRYAEKRRLMGRIRLLEHEHAMERERARISQDMHDEVGSSLSEIAILSELAKRKPEEAETRVAEIAERTAELIDSVSEIVWAMNPKNDTLDNLVAHMRRYSVKYLGLARIRCKFVAPEAVPASPLAAEVRRNLFLVVKESLHNVVKHSKATEVTMTVKCDEGRMEILIADNGNGFLLDERSAAGNGLNNMKRRIADVGGEFNVESRPACGTNISLAIKLAQVPDKS